jgi:general secretion pathway protein H
MRRRNAEAGMTLVETLVVLALVAIASGAAVTGLAPRPAQTAAAEAARLAALLSLAGDAALSGGAPVALVWTAPGYAFRHAPGARGDWRPFASGPLAADRDLPAGVTLRRGDGAAPPVLLARGGLAAAAVLDLADARGRTRVLFDGLAARVAGAAP